MERIWGPINGFYLDVSHVSSPSRAVEAPHEFFTPITRSGHLIEGVTTATMSQGRREIPKLWGKSSHSSYWRQAGGRSSTRSAIQFVDRNRSQPHHDGA